MSKPTFKMLKAVKAIAFSRGDYENTVWFNIHDWSFEQASEYIEKFGRKVRVNA